MATPPGGAPDPQKAKVGKITEEELTLKNQLALKSKINQAAKEELSLQRELNKLGQQAIVDATKYYDTSKRIAEYEKKIATAKKQGDTAAEAFFRAQVAQQKQQQRSVANMKNSNALLYLQQQKAAEQNKKALQAERQLIKDINKERGIGSKITDLFRTKEGRQKQIDMARMKAGGGANKPPGGGGGGGNEDAALAAAGPYGAMAVAMKKVVDSIKGMLSGVGTAIKSALVAPLGEAAAMMGSKTAVGIGGGAVSGAGATSILDGFGSMLGTIPLIGGALQGLTSAFKTVLDAVLGIDQANTNVARSMGTSKEEAKAFREEMLGVQKAYGSVVVNQTRLVESQLELGDALGITNKLSADILANNVQLKDVLGLELDARKAIAASSTVTGRKATDITNSLRGQVEYLKATTGISLKYQTIFSEIGKLSGVLGLTFLKNDKALGNTLVKVKSLGLDLKQVNDIAAGFLDFESSISKEFEAQVLTGKDINLTKAREAALNNDLATVAQEISKYTGDSNHFLKMNRIEADALAGAMNMTRDQMADMLKEQELLTRANVADKNALKEKYELLVKQGKKQEEIKDILGAAGMEEAKRTSIAEKLAGVMDQIKTTFIAFIEKSKIFDFLTDEKKVNGFIRSILDNLAGAINMVGEIAAGIMDAISHLPFTDKEKYQGLAEQIRSGAGGFAGSVRSVGGGIGLADGGVVTETGMAKVDKGEVYLGANSISVLKDMLDAQREQNKHLMALLAKDTRLSIDGQAIAVANARNATTIYQGQTS